MSIEKPNNEQDKRFSTYGQYGSPEKFSQECFCEPLRPGQIPVVLISGPNGVGKGSIIAELLKVPFLPIRKTSRFTSREVTDADKGSYASVSPEVFREKVIAGDFLEWSHHVPGYYGTALSTLNDIALNGKTPIVDVDIEAAQFLKAVLTQCGIRCVDIIILPNEENSLNTKEGIQSILLMILERMMQRNRSADREDLLGRVERSKILLSKYAKMFKYKVVNRTGRLEDAAQDTASIISQHLKS